MPKRWRSLTLIMLALAVGVVGCRREGRSGGAAGSLPEGTNVLLITLDTTRADRIGCYDYAAAETPTLDDLAARGTLFERAYAQAPITLPSHCSIMTGRYPREHGVRVNGRNALSDTHPTLAGIFREKGYRTGAFVGAFVLDKRYQLNRGFDHYDDDMGAQHDEGFGHQHVERPADVVTERALRWLEQGGDKPFFAWVHYFDPHDPYEPPAAFQRPGRHPYDGELAFVDSQIKRLLDWLNTRNLTERTLIVVVGDHGEALGERGIQGHTLFLYEVDVHVPFIITHAGVVPRGRRVPDPVEALDVFPTLLDMFGWKAPPGLLCQSLVDRFTSSEPKPRSCYAETHHPNWSFGWAQQRTLITHRWKYISTTRPELYDLTADRGEMRNVIDDNPRVAAEMKDALRRFYLSMTPGEAADVALDDAARRGLESLGYVSGGVEERGDDFFSPGLPDPKDMLPVLNAMNRARGLMDENRFVEAIPLLERSVEASPQSMSGRYLLGSCYVNVGRYEEAVRELDAALRLDPAYASALSRMGDALRNLGRLDEAAKHYQTALAIDDMDARTHAALAQTLRRMGETQQAIRHNQRALEIDPTFAGVHVELGIIYESTGDVARAASHYNHAVVLDPDDARARFNLGIALVRGGRLDDARRHLRESVRLDDSLSPMLLQRGTALLREGASGGAAVLDQCAVLFDLAAEHPPLAADAHYHLGHVAARKGEEASAVKAYEKALSLNPGHEPSITALMRYYVGRKQIADAVRVLRGGVAAHPDHLGFNQTLAAILASAGDEAVRDGAQAIVLAQRVVNLTDRQQPAPLAILAAAHAETGDFDRATALAEEALSLAESTGNQQVVGLIRGQLEGYRAGRPYLAPEF